MSKKVYFIILNWNLSEDTIACVHSLLYSGVNSEHIIVVDNGSNDDSVRKIKKEFRDEVHYVLSATNRGFAGGNNFGIRYALDLGAEWVFLLNNDTVVDKNFFYEISQALKQSENFDVMGPLIFYANDPEIIWSMGDRLIPGTLFTRQLLRNKKVPDKLSPFVEVDFVTGCGLLVKRNVLEAVGVLDERFFMYSEDAEFCWRVKNNGFRIAVATKARIWHKVAQSGGKHNEQMVMWRIRNQIWFYRLSAKRGQLILMVLGTLLRVIGMVFRNFMYGRRHLNSGIIAGWKAGWFGTIENKSNLY